MSRYIKFLDTLENSDEITNREELKKAINLAKAIEPKENIIMAGKSFFLNKYSQMYNDNPVNKDNNDYDSCDKYLYLENNNDFHEKMKCFQQQTLLFCDMLYDLRESVQYL